MSLGWRPASERHMSTDFLSGLIVAAAALFAVDAACFAWLRAQSARAERLVLAERIAKGGHPQSIPFTGRHASSVNEDS